MTVEMPSFNPGTKPWADAVKKLAAEFEVMALNERVSPTPSPDVSPSLQLEAYDQAMSSLIRERDEAALAIERLKSLKQEIMFSSSTRAAFLNEVVEGKHLKEGDR